MRPKEPKECSAYYPLCGFQKKDFPVYITPAYLKQFDEFAQVLESNFMVSIFDKSAKELFFSNGKRNLRMKEIYPEWVDLVNKTQAKALRKLSEVKNLTVVPHYALTRRNREVLVQQSSCGVELVVNDQLEFNSNVFKQLF